jgi:[NiFe] hydrogenase assembly HybE family chaperone
MSERISKLFLASSPTRSAGPWRDDPSEFLAAHFEHVWQTRKRDLPSVNPALTVDVIGFSRQQGDWLGVVVTPWFINLFMFSGGGELWGDIPAGQRRYVNLPCGTVQFIADDDPDLGPYQYCPVIAPVSSVPDMATARKAGLDALAAIIELPAPPVADTAAAAEPAQRDVSRRGFLRALTGRR